MTLRLISNAIFHDVRGIPGWSVLDYTTIDVAHVDYMGYHKRRFCLFHKNYPYTFYIYNNHHVLTKRLETEKECIDQINEITKKQNDLDKLSQDVYNKIRSHHQ